MTPRCRQHPNWIRTQSRIKVDAAMAFTLDSTPHPTLYPLPSLKCIQPKRELR
ncbi:MAG: hypothetical protein MJA27_34345 [Pseudanabaenales cyanobacterium]|nr:hypothetical protein [Pseudanabaenales cyanobacterium]